MMEGAESMTINEQTVYKFRFDNSNQLIELNQSHLDHIPYLQALVAHKDDFSSCQNIQDEYILHHPIRYSWFMSIFHAITTEQPYALFSELSETDNILDVIQLLDYLGISRFSPPLLNEPNLVLSNQTNNDNRKCIEYRRASSLSEARNTAAEFVLALTRNQYNLHDFKTIECIFSLISVIFSDGRVFSSQFRYHAFTVVEEHVFPLFAIKNSVQLLATLEQRNTIDSKIYLDDNTQPLPADFENTFAWKGVYISIEKRSEILIMGMTGLNIFSLNVLLYLQEYICPTVRIECSSFFPRTTDHTYITEAQSARSGRFNTMPKRPEVDRFKQRCGRKAQKHR